MNDELKEHDQISPWLNFEEGQEENLLKSKRISLIITKNTPKSSGSARIPRVATLSKGFEEKIVKKPEKNKKWFHDMKFKDINSQSSIKNLSKMNKKASLKKQLNRGQSHPVIQRTLGSSYVFHRIKSIVDAAIKLEKYKSSKTQQIKKSKTFNIKINKIPKPHLKEIRFQNKPIETNTPNQKKISFVARPEKKHFLDKYLDPLI